MVTTRLTSDLEERLSRDASRAELEKIISTLGGYSSEVKKKLDAGVSPETFKNLSAFRGALETAASCLPAIWQQCQSK